MKCSGRSVEDASRVIEIDEVLRADDRLRLQRRAEIGEDAALDVFLLGRGLDHEVAVAERVVAVGRRDALERGLALVVGDALAAHLPRHVAVDGGDAGLDAVGGDVVEQHVEAGQRADMGDAAAHLTGADDADLANVECHRFCPFGAARLRAILDVDS